MSSSLQERIEKEMERLENVVVAKYMTQQGKRDRIRASFITIAQAAVEEERVIVCSPQWIKDDPAWLCVLFKGEDVLAEKVCTETELSAAYLRATGRYASTVISIEQCQIGAKEILTTLKAEEK